MLVPSDTIFVALSVPRGITTCRTILIADRGNLPSASPIRGARLPIPFPTCCAVFASLFPEAGIAGATAYGSRCRSIVLLIIQIAMMPIIRASIISSAIPPLMPGPMTLMPMACCTRSHRITAIVAAAVSCRGRSRGHIIDYCAATWQRLLPSYFHLLINVTIE